MCNNIRDYIETEPLSDTIEEEVRSTSQKEGEPDQIDPEEVITSNSDLIAFYILMGEEEFENIRDPSPKGLCQNISEDEFGVYDRFSSSFRRIEELDDERQRNGVEILKKLKNAKKFYKDKFDVKDRDLIHSD